MSAICWPRCTGMIARVRGVIAGLDQSGIDGQMLRVDVHDHRQCAGCDRGIGGGGEGQRGHDHLVAPADPQRLQRDLHGDRAVGHDDAVAGALILGKSLGERRRVGSRLGPAAHQPASHHGRHRLHVALVQVGPAGKGIGSHRRPTGDREHAHGVASRDSLDFSPANSLSSTGTFRKVSLLYASGERATSTTRTFDAGTPSLLKAINERTILELIRDEGMLSRAQMARRSGLSKPTVSQALVGLSGAGLVIETGRSTGRKGPGAALVRAQSALGVRGRPGRRPKLGAGGAGRHHRPVRRAHAGAHRAQRRRGG